MPSNRLVRAARWRLCASGCAVADTQISARYHSNGGVREGDCWRICPHLFFGSGRLVLSQPNMEERRDLKVLAFFRDDEGQGLVEYALIIAVIAIAVIVAMIFLRGQLQNIFSNIGNNLT